MKILCDLGQGLEKIDGNKDEQKPTTIKSAYLDFVKSKVQTTNVALVEQDSGKQENSEDETKEDSPDVQKNEPEVKEGPSVIIEEKLEPEGKLNSS